MQSISRVNWARPGRRRPAGRSLAQQPFRRVPRCLQIAGNVRGLVFVGNTRVATVLVVDDDSDLLQIAAEVLRQDGHQVLTARSGEEALTTLEHHRVDLLLTD